MLRACAGTGALPRAQPEQADESRAVLDRPGTGSRGFLQRGGSLASGPTGKLQIPPTAPAWVSTLGHCLSHLVFFRHGPTGVCKMCLRDSLRNEYLLHWTRSSRRKGCVSCIQDPSPMPGTQHLLNE